MLLFILQVEASLDIDPDNEDLVKLKTDLQVSHVTRLVGHMTRFKWSCDVVSMTMKILKKQQQKKQLNIKIFINFYAYKAPKIKHNLSDYKNSETL